MRIKKVLISLAIIAAMLSVVSMAIPTRALQEASNALITPNTLLVRGSSTVYPISILAQGPFQAKYPGITVSIPAAEGSGADPMP